MLFKAIGLALIFAVCSLGGFFKSSLLMKRADKLSKLSRALSQLSEYIRADGGELERLIGLCFEKSLLHTENGRPVLNKSFLENEDIALLEEFFESFGTKDIQGEYERTGLYASLIEKQKQEAAEKCSQLCRLYNALGVLGGIFICIFLL